jgi:hypothetical protein
MVMAKDKKYLYSGPDLLKHNPNGSLKTLLPHVIAFNAGIGSPLRGINEF